MRFFSAFQVVKFYSGCILLCDNCTLDQLATTTLKWQPTNQNKDMIIAVQGAIDSISLKSQKETNVSLLFSFLHVLENFDVSASMRPAIQPLRGRAPSLYLNVSAGTFNLVQWTNKFATVLEQEEGYNIHFHRIEYGKKLFFIVKYADNAISSTTEYQNHVTQTQEYPEIYFVDSYPFPDCPHKVHYPKKYTWNEAQELCHLLEGTMPQLVSRKDQNDLVLILHEQAGPLFFIEAVFIDFKKATQVGKHLCFYVA